jgi:hypothetical protein
MALKFDLSGSVKRGKMVWDQPSFAKGTFAQFEEKKVLITLQLFKRKRSYLQNAYWWGVVIEMVYATFRGFGERISKADCHEMLKLKFLEAHFVDPVSGEIAERYTRSSTDLTTVEFMEFIAQTQQYMAEQYGIVIPDPNEYLIQEDEKE